MIKYDYRLERDESTERTVFRPRNFPTELDDLTYIEGPNSSGKSTLLNIVALGLYGLKKDRLNPALREKLRNLMAAEHQRLTFELTINNALSGLQISSKKSDPKMPEIELLEIKNGKSTKLSSDAFSRKYNLIYDIPDNPTERLKQLTIEIRNVQMVVGNKIGALRNSILNAIVEIKDAKDPMKLEEFRKIFKSEKEGLDQFREKILFYGELIDRLEKYASCVFYKEYSGNLSRLLNTLDRVEEQKKQSRKKSKKIGKELEELLKKIKTNISILEDKYNKVTFLIAKLIPAGEKHRLKLWKEISIRDEIYNSEFHDLIRKESKHFEMILRSLLEEDENEKSFQEATVFNDLLELLSHYQSSTVVIPGLEKTIPEFIEILKDKVSFYDNIRIRHQNIETAVSSLVDLRRIRDETIQGCIPTYRELSAQLESSDKETGDFYEEDHKEKLDPQIKRYQEKMDYYKRELAKKDIDEMQLDLVLTQLRSIKELSPYFVFTEDQLIKKTFELKHEYLDLKNRKRKRNNRCISTERKSKNWRKKRNTNTSST